MSKMEIEDDIDKTLRKKRKAREHTSCYPCRYRKVKCSGRIPCDSCVARDHVNLCTLERPNLPIAARSRNGNGDGNEHGTRGLGEKTAKTTITPYGGNQDSPSTEAPYDTWFTSAELPSRLEAAEKSISILQEEVRRLSRKPTRVRPPEHPIEQRSSYISFDDEKPLQVHDNVTRETIHLGGKSNPAFLLQLCERLTREDPQRWSQVCTFLHDHVLSVFGLQNTSTTYPFVNLWATDDSSADNFAQLRSGLPSDAECFNALREYRSKAHIISPGILHIDDFGHDLGEFLVRRASSMNGGFSHDPVQHMYGKKIPWVGVLFAVLAAASQFGSLPLVDRSLTSRVFVCFAFQCLRVTNFFQRPSLESVQALLLIVIVIQNDMNPGAAWILIGVAVRSAQSLGIHRSDQNPNLSPSVSRLQRELWCALLWQDCVLSLAYDRESVTSGDPSDSLSLGSGYSTYGDSRYKLCQIIQDILHDRKERTSQTRTFHHFSKVCMLLSGLNFASSNTIPFEPFEDMAGKMVLRFLLSHTASELCRPPDPSSINSFETKALRADYIRYLRDTVENFLEMFGISPKFVRTWAALHRTLSSALILGVLAGSNVELVRDVKDLLERLVEALSNVNTIECDAVSAVDSRSDNGGGMTEEGPLDKGIMALRLIGISLGGGNTLMRSPAVA